MAYRGPRNHAGLQALVSALVLLLVPGSTHGERPPVRFFTTADGLPSPRVASIVRDSHGFLWIGTIGLSRFDGRSFQTFGPAEGLAQPAVNYVLEERPGRYWVATNGGGLFRFTPRTAGGSPDATRFVRVAVGATQFSKPIHLNAPSESHCPSRRSTKSQASRTKQCPNPNSKCSKTLIIGFWSFGFV